MKKILSVCLSVLVASALFAADAERTWNSEDTAPGIRIHNGYTGNISLNVTNSGLGNMIVTDGTTSSNIASVGLLTIEEIAACVSKYTNASGDRLLTVDVGSIVPATSSSNLFLVGAITNRPGQWTTAAKVDTSNAKFFSTYIPSSKVGGNGNRKVLTDIYGDVGGTGNIALTVYADGSKVYQKTIVSPIYVPASMDGTLTNDVTTSDDVTMGYIHEKLNIPFNGSESVLIKGARSTTATTGGLGASITILQ